jgi:hypothetical protein
VFFEDIAVTAGVARCATREKRPSAWHGGRRSGGWDGGREPGRRCAQQYAERKGW